MWVNVLVGRNGGEEGKVELFAAADSYTGPLSKLTNAANPGSRHRRGPSLSRRRLAEA